MSSIVDLKLDLSTLENYQLDDVINKAIELKNTHIKFQKYKEQDTFGTTFSIEMYDNRAYQLCFNYNTPYTIRGMKASIIQYLNNIINIDQFDLVNEDGKLPKYYSNDDDKLYIKLKDPTLFQLIKHKFKKRRLLHFSIKTSSKKQKI